jgi:hypothetical protein
MSSTQPASLSLYVSATMPIFGKSIEYTKLTNKVLNYMFSWGLVQDQRRKAHFRFEGRQCLISVETRSDNKIFLQ